MASGEFSSRYMLRSNNLLSAYYFLRLTCYVPFFELPVTCLLEPLKLRMHAINILYMIGTMKKVNYLIYLGVITLSHNADPRIQDE